MKAFLKWVGGKQKIVDRIKMRLPTGKRLIEPFAGGASVFMSTNYPDNLIADINPDIINTYKQIQIGGTDFIAAAAALYCAENNTLEMYNKLRNEFNTTTDIKRKSTLFVYLNRHGFNGLCRYNSSGAYNVAFGYYFESKKPKFPLQEILNFAEKSQGTVFQCANFKETMASAEPGDVVYCDPPYVSFSSTKSFTGYTSAGFDLDSHKILADTAVALAKRGIPVLISNHDTEYSRILYKSATSIEYFNVQRTVSSDGTNRIKAAEILALFI